MNPVRQGYYHRRSKFGAGGVMHFLHSLHPAALLQNSFALLKGCSSFMKILLKHFNNFRCFMVELPSLG